MLFAAIQASNGILVESNAPFWDWLIPVMYVVLVILIVLTIGFFVGWFEEEISPIPFIITLILAIAASIFTLNAHSNLEETDGYGSIAERISEKYGVKVSSGELRDNDLHGVLDQNTVSKIILETPRESKIIRNDDTGYFEQAEDAQYSIIVDGRVIELVKVEKAEDGSSIFIPLETVK